MKQLSIDFSQSSRHHEEPKKLDRIPIAASEELKTFLRIMAEKQGITSSELAHRYIVEGIRNDFAKIFMPEPHLDKSLRDVLSKF